ncbi:Structural maintenance of chromosomes protein 6 [Chytridiales sp. JEL 0842]|nr:Structural maintenance of chromosomes protein 6 [Chytridiales sp. JEL 0842]
MNTKLQRMLADMLTTRSASLPGGISHSALRDVNNESPEPADIDTPGAENEIQSSVTRRRKTTTGIVFEDDEDDEQPVRGAASNSSSKRARQREEVDEDEDEQPVRGAASNSSSKRARQREEVEDDEDEQPVRGATSNSSNKRARQIEIEDDNDKEPVQGTPLKSSNRIARHTREERDDEHDEPVQPASSKPSYKRFRHKMQEDDDDDDDFEVAQGNEAEEEDDDDEEEDEEEKPQTQLTQKAKTVRSTGRSSKSKSMPTPEQAMPPSTGTVESVELFNFMCHKLLRVQFNPNINFVIGHNGSGKSAILTALTVCLGGKATFTNRGSSIKSLLKEGTTGGTVSVTLRNQGPDAYRPEQYGDRITIERKILKDDQEISRKREEIIAILDHFSIAIDNPMAILTQDTSRQFLANSTPKEKYSFFLKGTLLAQLKSDHALISEYIKRAERIVNTKEKLLPEMKQELEKLKARWKEIEASQNLERDIEKLKEKVIWARVSEKEENVKITEDEIVTLHSKRKAVEQKLADYEIQFQELLKLFKQAEVQKNELFKSGHPLIDRLTSREDEMLTIKNEIAEYNGAEKNVANELKSVENHSKVLANRIREEQSKLQEDTQAKIEQQQAEINAANIQLDVIRQRCGEIHQQQDVIQADLDRTHSTVKEKEDYLNDLQSKIADDERYLRNIQAAKDNRLRAFPINIQRIVQAIEQIEHQGKWKGKKPIGPCGALMTVNKPEFSKVIHSILSSDLNSFICFDHDDAKSLRDLFKQFKCYASVIVNDNREFDFSSGEADPKYLTVLRALDFADPIVMRQMILNYRIEALVLVKTRHEGDSIAVRGFNSRLRGVYSMELVRHGGLRGGLQTTVLYERREGHVMQVTNQQSHVDECIQRVQANKALVHEVEYDLHGFKDRRERLEGQLKHIKLEAQRLVNEEKKWNFEIQRLHEELQEEEPANIAALETEKRGLEEQMQILNGQLADLQATKESRKAAFKELQAEKEAIKNELNVLKAKNDKAEENIQQLTKSMEAIVKNKDFESAHVADYDNRIKEADIRLEQQKKEAHDELRKALELSNHRMELGRNETIENLERKLRELEIKLREARKVTGSPEEVQAKLNIALEEYHFAKAELKSAKRLIIELEKGLQERIAAWYQLRRRISIAAKHIFSLNMRTRGFTAKLILDHKHQTLDLRVDVHGAQKRSMASHNHDAHGSQDSFGEKDPKTLSGGEKSFSTVCLLLSLWESMGNPFRALDEYDVFMDAVNRKISTKMMIENARKEGGGCQYIFITPLDMSNVAMGPDVKINRLSDPERNQSVLNFNRGS